MRKLFEELNEVNMRKDADGYFEWAVKVWKKSNKNVDIAKVEGIADRLPFNTEVGSDWDDNVYVYIDSKVDGEDVRNALTKIGLKVSAVMKDRG